MGFGWIRFFWRLYVLLCYFCVEYLCRRAGGRYIIGEIIRVFLRLWFYLVWILGKCEVFGFDYVVVIGF